MDRKRHKKRKRDHHVYKLIKEKVKEINIDIDNYDENYDYEYASQIIEL